MLSHCMTPTPSSTLVQPLVVNTPHAPRLAQHAPQRHPLTCTAPSALLTHPVSGSLAVAPLALPNAQRSAAADAPWLDSCCWSAHSHPCSHVLDWGALWCHKVGSPTAAAAAVWLGSETWRGTCLIPYMLLLLVVPVCCFVPWSQSGMG
jgi:hypothetical protein